MRIEIDSDGTIFCDGNVCEPAKAQSAPCTDCPMNRTFVNMFACCDPLNCQKIVCAGCHYRYFYEKRRHELEDEQFRTF